MLLLLFAVVGLVVSQDALPFTDHCRERLAVGRDNVQWVSMELVEKEIAILLGQYHSAFEDMNSFIGAQQADEKVPPTNEPEENCPRPNATMFTTKPPPTIAPTQQNTDGTTAGAGAPITDSTSGTSGDVGTTTTAPADGTAASGDPGTTTVPMDGTAPSNGEFSPVPMYFTEGDPVVTHFKTLHKYVNDPENVCDNQFTDINSITEHQLYGFFATLATAHPGPFCALCHEFVDTISTKAFAISDVLLKEEEKLMLRMLYSHVPTTKGICSALAPGCYENYEEQVANSTEAVECAKCSGCMSVTNVLQHRFLLNPDGVQSLLRFLQNSLFHNICAEFCLAFAPIENLVMFPGGFTYDKCQNWFVNHFDGLVRFLTVFTRPERLCMLETGWCELNEVPNMLHCLREFCDSFLADVPHTRALCGLIPDSPEEADEFLNIKRTKKYRGKQRRGDGSSEHDEL